MVAQGSVFSSAQRAVPPEWIQPRAQPSACRMSPDCLSGRSAVSDSDRPRLWGLSRNCKCRGVYKRVGLYKNLTPSGAGRHTCGGLLRRLLRLLFSLLLIRCQYAVCSDVPVYRASRGFARPADLLLTSRRVAYLLRAVLLSCVGDRRRQGQDGGRRRADRRDRGSVRGYGYSLLICCPYTVLYYDMMGILSLSCPILSLSCPMLSL